MAYKNLSKRRLWRRNHPEISRRWRKKHPQKNKQSHRDFDARHRYGFSSYKEMLKVRNRPCMICGKKAKKMCIDHKGPAAVFNQTYRGVLCQQCNTRLGWFERRRRAILEYVKRGSMPAVSKKQAIMMRIAEHEPEKLYARNKGAASMSHKQLHEFAKTPDKGLPTYAHARAARKKNGG